MATRYWVGGTGTWNGSSTTNWAASSGGASGASAPTSADDVVVDTSSGGGTITIASGAACNNCTINWTAAKTNALTLSANFAPAGTLTINGNSVTNRILVQSSALGTARTITAAAVSLTNVDFTDITGAGAATWSGTSLGDCLGNSGITFTPAATQYWYSPNATAGQTFTWSTAGNWFLGSGGTGGSGRVPLPQDDVVFNAGSIRAGTTTVTHDMPRSGKNVTWTGVTNSPTFRQDQVSFISFLYGSLTLASGMSLAVGGSGGTFRFAGRGSHTLDQAGVVWTGTWAFEASGGTYSLASAIVGYRIDLMAGTLTTNGYTVTANAIVWTNGSTYAKTLNMGASQFVLAGNNTAFSRVWDMTTANTTINADTSTIKLTDASATAKDLRMGSKIYNNIELAGAGTGSFNFTGSNTFADFKISGGAKTIKFIAGTTTTIASATGFEDNAATITSITSATHTLAKSGGGTVSMRGANVSYSIASPAATFYAGATGVNGGNNTNWTFNNAPATASAAFTEDADTTAAAAANAIAASAAFTEADDTLAAAAANAIAASAAFTEADDTLAAAAANAIAASAAFTDDADTLAAALYRYTTDARRVIKLRRRTFTATL